MSRPIKLKIAHLVYFRLWTRVPHSWVKWGYRTIRDAGGDTRILP